MTITQQYRDQSRTIIATYYYDAFGNILEQTGSASNSILFAGYQYDAETGMYYLNARMYDPVTARFMQEDTYTGQYNDPLSLNLYTYCHNEPLMYSDPTGHSRVGWGNPRVREPFSPPVKLKRDKSVVKSMVEEKEKQTKEAQRTHNRYENIGRYLKSNPTFAEQDYVQLTMEQAGNMGQNAYLTAMEYHIADYVLYKPGESFDEWQEKQIRTNMDFIPTDEFGKAAEIWEMKKDKKNYATQRLLTYRDCMPAESYEDYFEPEIGLIMEVYANTPMTLEQEDLFWKAPTWLGTPYLRVQLAVKQEKSDCSAFARGLYMEMGIFISIDGSSARCSAGMLKAAQSGTDTKKWYMDNFKKDMEKYSQEYDLVEKNGTTAGEIIYNYEAGDELGDWINSDGEIIKGSINSLELETGDVIFYNLYDEGVGHVGVYFGNNADGDPIIIETSNNDVNLVILEPGEYNYNNRTTQNTRTNSARITAIVRYL